MTGGAPGFVVRPGTTRDLAAVVRIENRSFTDPWSPGTLFGELQAEGMRITLVAEKSGQVCGYIMAWIVVDQLHVLNIATDPDHLRQGLGTALLREAARQGVSRGAVEVTLEVRRGNRAARAFYKRHFFAETGVRPAYYRDNGEDAIIMTASCSDLVAVENGRK